MDTDDSLCPGGDFFRRGSRVNLPSVRQAVCEYRGGARIGNAPCSCDIGVGGDDYLIAGANTQCQHGKVQGGSSVIDPTGIFHAYIRRKFPVECIRKFSAGKRGIPAYLLDGMQIFFPMCFIISCQINSFDYCIFHPVSLKILS